MTETIVSGKKAAYDPGTPTEPRQTGPNTWAIDSFRSGGSYVVTVTPTETRCSCPHWAARIAPLASEGALCKHGQAVHAAIAAQPQPTKLAAAATKAKRLKDEELRRYAAERNGTAAGCACLLELAQRQIAANRDAELKTVFA